jgi:predicted DNA-binding transcriptional regulator AlpA
MRQYERSHLYRSSQVALILGISKKTLDRMIAAGRIPTPARDRNNNWRVWTHQEVIEIKEFVGSKREGTKK